MNEPWSTAVLGHGLGAHAPGIKEQAKAVYEAGHTQLLAHAAAVKVLWVVVLAAGWNDVEQMTYSIKTIYQPCTDSSRRQQLYKQKYQAKQKGKIGIILSTQFKEPLCDSNSLDVAAAERNLQFYLGWFASPIFKGDYPPVMRERAGDRLPTFTDEQKEDLKGSADFLGLNTYSSSMVTDRASVGGGYFDDVATKSSVRRWPRRLPMCDCAQDLHTQIIFSYHFTIVALHNIRVTLRGQGGSLPGSGWHRRACGSSCSGSRRSKLYLLGAFLELKCWLKGSNHDRLAIPHLGTTTHPSILRRMAST